MNNVIIVSEHFDSAISLVDLYHTQYGQTDKLWNYFGVITLAVLGFTIGNDKATKSFNEASLIVIGYWVFCLGNFNALLKAQYQLQEFASHAAIAAKEAGIPLNHLDPIPPDNVRFFYCGVVIVVTIGILTITRIKRGKNQESKLS